MSFRCTVCGTKVSSWFENEATVYHCGGCAMRVIVKGDVLDDVRDEAFTNRDYLEEE